MRSHPKAVSAILFNHYIDDNIDSLYSLEETANLAADIVTVHTAHARVDFQ